MPKRPKRSSGTGYGQPPKNTRFRSGRSGNPKGRPKGSKNLSSQYLAEVNAPIPITENGKRRLVSKLGAAIKQQVTKGAAGDLRAVQQILDRVSGIETKLDQKSSEAAHFTDADRQVIEAVYARLIATNEVPDE